MYANTSKEKGCSTCPYAGHFDLKECPNAYTEKSKECGNYNHEQLCTQIQTNYSKCEFEEETCRTCVNHLNTLVCPITVQDKADIHGCNFWQSKKDADTDELF